MKIYLLLKAFWQIRNNKRITSLQADVYYFLLYKCNLRRWETTFECYNKRICATINISEQSLIKASARLKHYGLIDLKNGHRNVQSPKYRLLLDGKPLHLTSKE